MGLGTRWFWHPYSDFNVKRRGRWDGEKAPAIPPWDEPRQPPFLMALKQAGDNDVRILARRWSTIDQSRKGAWLKAHRTLVGSRKPRVQAEEVLERACDAYRQERGVDPPAGGDSRFFVHNLLMFLLFVFEFPMNAIVFRLFGENEIFTYVATAAIALSLLIGAHYLGTLLREGNFADPRNGIMVACSIAIPLIVIVGIGYLREVYLAQSGFMSSAMSPTGMWAVFAALNLLIYLVATVSSYRVHDPPLVAVHRARRQCAGAQGAYARAERALTRAETRREKKWEAFHTRAHQVKDAVQRLTDVYRTHNLEHRSDRSEAHGTGYPKCFEEYPDVTIPPGLEELDWNTDEKAFSGEARSVHAGANGPGAAGAPTPAPEAVGGGHEA